MRYQCLWGGCNPPFGSALRLVGCTHPTNSGRCRRRNREWRFYQNQVESSDVHRARSCVEFDCPIRCLGFQEENVSVSMLGKLKDLFASSPSSSSSGGSRRVNLEKRFSIVSESSRGSMSKVYRALDNQTGKTVCLKVQSREKNEAATARASSQERRPFEGEMAIHLVHPHIVRTFEHGSTNRGEHFLVMEFIDRSASSSSARRGRHRPARAACPGSRRTGCAARGRIHPPRHQPAQLPGGPRSEGQADRLRPEHSQSSAVLRTGQPDRDSSVHGT